MCSARDGSRRRRNQRDLQHRQVDEPADEHAFATIRVHHCHQRRTFGTRRRDDRELLVVFSLRNHTGLGAGEVDLGPLREVVTVNRHLRSTLERTGGWRHLGERGRRTSGRTRLETRDEGLGQRRSTKVRHGCRHRDEVVRGHRQRALRRQCDGTSVDVERRGNQTPQRSVPLSKHDGLLRHGLQSGRRGELNGNRRIHGDLCRAVFRAHPGHRETPRQKGRAPRLAEAGHGCAGDDSHAACPRQIGLHGPQVHGAIRAQCRR